jgi:hypothetical protein
MKTRTMMLLVGTILAATLAAPVAAAEVRPMSGQFTAVGVAVDPRCGPNALTLGFEIQGTATHLGSLTGSGSNCTEFTLATSAVEIWDGVATFTAADGSTITTVSEGEQAAPVAGRAGFLIDHTVIGGTGRFASASGLWIVSGVIDFTNGTLAGQVTGWLYY